MISAQTVTDKNYLLVIVPTERGNTIRIISARITTKTERKHDNPVKHELTKSPIAWPYSSDLLGFALLNPTYTVPICSALKGARKQSIGYGDISPRTPLGRLFAFVVMLFGYSILPCLQDPLNQNI